jgi:2-methylisocitrate lyase-like PEP mutase family enzyme
LPTDELLGAVRRITRVLMVPLTVDIEDGYSDSPETVAALARRIADAGAVGINIEDGSKAPQLLADKIRAIRAELPANALLVNARTDVYLRGLVPTAEAVAMTIERLRLYADAGTDGVFVPGLAALPDTREITAALNKPLNLMLVPQLPGVDELHAAGVRRISAGPAPFRVAYDAANRAVGAFMQGDFQPMAAARLDFRTLNGLFSDSH